MPLIHIFFQTCIGANYSSQQNRYETLLCNQPLRKRGCKILERIEEWDLIIGSLSKLGDLFMWGTLSFLFWALFILFGLPFIVFLIWCLMPSKEDKQAEQKQSNSTWSSKVAKSQPETEHDYEDQAYQRVPQEYRKYISAIKVIDGHAKVSFDFKDVTSDEISEKADTLARAMRGEILDVTCNGVSIKDTNSKQDGTITRAAELSDVMARYRDVIRAFDEYTREYAVDKKVIDDESTVYIIEDSAIYLIRLEESKSDDWAGYPMSMPGRPSQKRYKAAITEVTYNSVFNFVKSRFEKQLGFYHFMEFTGFGYYGDRSVEQMYINEKLPSIDIFGRLASWDGVPYNFIVFETRDENGVVGRACCHTESQLVSQEAHKAAKELQNTIAYRYKVNVNKQDGMYEHIKEIAEKNGTTPEKDWLKCSAPKSMLGESNAICFGIDDDFTRILFERIAKMKDASDVVIKKDTTQFFDDRIVWFTFAQGVKNLFEAKFANVDYTVLREMSHGSYYDVEREVYVPISGKWKNEELMFRCIQKVLKGKPVIYQHSPFFLGKQSYDVFVPGEKIAFEYQGKQHFEPVEFFGGEESHKSQVERDKRKKELSEKNGVTLIYVNYWEDVSEELIMQKLAEAGKTKIIPLAS